MKTTLVTFVLIMICICNTFADIGPNPIQAKGIIANGSNDIRMVSERVIVDLYKDSSVVECHFYMQNDGKSQQINIGFPEMNFHYLLKTKAEEFRNAFSVYENGIAVPVIGTYTPDLKLQADTLLDQRKSTIEYVDQPWYLWDSQFKEGEAKIIKVRYTLPVGKIKSRCDFFTYLLNTGAGWKGSIDTAEVIVNFNGISTDLILKATPLNYELKDNQIRWKFSNLEPTTSDDIKVYFESSKGMYETMKTKYPSPLVFLNGKNLPGWDVIYNPQLPDSLLSLEILDIKVLKDEESTKKYTSGKDAILVIFTKDYAIEKLDSLLKAKKSSSYPLKYNSTFDFLERYKLTIDQSEYANEKMLLRIVGLEKKEIRNVTVRNDEMGKTIIDVKLKK